MVHTVTDGIIIIFGDEIKTAVLLNSMIPMQKVKEHVLSPDQNESSQVLTCHGCKPSDQMIRKLSQGFENCDGFRSCAGNSTMLKYQIR